MAALDHFTDDPRTQDVRVGLAEVRSFLAEGSAKPVDDNDIAHSVVRHGVRKVG